MWLVYCIFVLLILCAFLAFLEDRLEPKTKIGLFYGFGLVLVLMAGLREIGFDPDSEGYEKYYHSYGSTNLLGAVEYSYILLSELLNEITYDAHAIFLVYALLGVFLKQAALKKYSDSLFLMMFVYLCYYFELHETTQMRTGALSAIMLFVILYIAEGKRLMAFLLIILGAFVHLSGLSLLLLLVLNNKPIDKKWMILLVAAIPVSYLLSASFNTLLAFGENIPYIGEKIARYQATEESGLIQVSGVNIFSPFHIFSIVVYYYLLFFSKIITENSKYYPILMRVLAIGLFFYAALSFLPVLGERLSMLYKIVIIVLFADLQFTVRPRWCGLLLSMLVSFVYLNYIMRSMYGVTMLLESNT